MMLHGIHNLELSQKNPSLDVGNIKTLIHFLCVWQKMLQHFPDSMLRLHIKVTIEILEKH